MEKLGSVLAFLLNKYHMRFKEFAPIFEAVGDNFLYHGTMPRNASKILRMNLLVGRTKQLFGRWRGRFKEKDIDIQGGEDAVMGVSLTRSPHFVKNWTTQSKGGSMASNQGVPGVVFVLDKTKLKQRHRIIPMEYIQRSGQSMNRAEAEEFVPGDIKNLNNYIHEIQIPAETYEWMKRVNDGYDYTDLLKHPKIKIIGQQQQVHKRAA
jgi:hypothetical protein